MIIKVYGWRNIHTDEWYVGQTSQLLKYRAGKNGSGYRESSKFDMAIKEWGWPSFEENILRLCTSREEADYWEKYYIEKYNSIEKGYNIAQGGFKIPIYRPVNQYSDNGKLIKRYDTILEASKQTGVCVGNISRCCQKQKFYKSAGGSQWRYADDDSPMKLNKPGKAIVQYDLNGQFISEYHSACEASKKTGICRSAIANALRGISQSAGNYRWEYI